MKKNITNSSTTLYKKQKKSYLKTNPLFNLLRNFSEKNSRLLKILKRIVFVVLFYKMFLEPIAFTIWSGKIVSTPYLMFGIYGVVFFILRVFVYKFKLNKNYIYSIALMIILLLLIECWLGFIDKNGPKTYLEKNNMMRYESSYRIHNWWNNDYKPNYEPNSTKLISKSEFSYKYHYNNYGFKGPDILTKKNTEYRIITLGDSFTEGLGAPDDSTWSWLMQQRLKGRYKSDINVVNLGKSGNDPVYALHDLKNIFFRFKPDMVILAINNSDINDMIARGGLERYDTSGNLHLRKSPWFEYLFAWSYIARKIIMDVFHYNFTLMKVLTIPKDMEERNDDEEMYKYMLSHHDEFSIAANKLITSVLQMHTYCISKGIQFVLVVSPDQWEMESVKYDEPGYYHYFLRGRFYTTYRILTEKNMFPVIFLLPSYLQQGMTAKNAHEYYWQLDYHNNSRGYNLFANGVFNGLTPILDSLAETK